MRRFKHDALLPLLAAETVVTGRATAGGGNDGDKVPPQHTLLLMPAVTDGSLQDVCDDVTNSRGRLPAAVLLSLCAQAASGLACMHAHSPPYAHRDVKPGNLLLQGWRPLQVPFASDVARSPAASTWSVRAMLCDFGSTRPARHAGEGGRPAARCLVEAAAAECSALYRPPELYHLDDPAMVDERVDVWALGCLLYAGMYGDSPFQYAVATGGSVALAVLSGKIRWPVAQQPYPEAMRQLVEWMLVADPRERPAMSDVAARLHATLAAPPWLQQHQPQEAPAWTPQFDDGASPPPLPPRPSQGASRVSTDAPPGSSRISDS